MAEETVVSQHSNGVERHVFIIVECLVYSYIVYYFLLIYFNQINKTVSWISD